MKKNLNILIFLFLIPSIIFAQKVDIDAFRFYISNTKLPINYIPVENRTFNVKVSGDWNNSELEQNINIPGWDFNNDSPNLGLQVKIEPMRRGNSSLKSRVSEQKDKNGKVTSSTTYYYVTSTNYGYGSFKIYGLKNEMPKLLSKKELEKKAKKEKEEVAKKESNPFLSNVDVKDVKDDVDENMSKEQAYSFSLDNSYTYTTSESTSSSAASKEYNNNTNSMYQNHMNEFVKHVIASANNYVTQYYGYSPVKNYVRFMELDSEKHPEYEMYSNATKALKTIFSKMRYNRSVEEVEKDLTPIIKYFDVVEQKYVKDDKHEKRLRAATLYNLATIFQYLDRHDKAIEIGNKMISLDLEKGDGEDIVEASTKIKRQLEFHHMVSRHIVPRNEAERAENEGEAEEAEVKP